LAATGTLAAAILALRLPSPKRPAPASADAPPLTSAQTITD